MQRHEWQAARDVERKQFEERLSILADDSRLNLLVPSGIGDIAWILSKFHSYPNVRFILADDEHHRAGSYLELLGLEYAYLPGLHTSWIWERDGSPELPATGCASIHANRHLESGGALKDWYPSLPWSYPVPHVSCVDSYDRPFVILFTCHPGYMGGNLSVQEWQALSSAYDCDVRFVGAWNDAILIKAIHGTSSDDLIDRPLSEMIAAMRNPLCQGMEGVAGGPSILGVLEGLQSRMFYPAHLDKMPGKWENNSCDWCLVDDVRAEVAGRMAA